MKKVLILITDLVSHSAFAATKLICSNLGDIKGSYYLDITGNEKIVNGTARSIESVLAFKYFRSYLQPIAKVYCGKPNAYLDAPGTILACRSGAPQNDYGPKGPTPYEATISMSQFGLVMSVTGPAVRATYGIYCRFQE